MNEYTPQSPRGQGPLHKAIVGVLLRNGCTKSKFTSSLWSAMSEGGEEMGIDFTLLPDAYRIEPETQEVFVYEVEVGHPLKTDAIMQYVRLWDYLDFYEWTLRLITVDRFAEPKERDLQALSIPLVGAAEHD